MSSLTSQENLCGQNLLRITAHGSAIIAELLRLSGNIPEVFMDEESVSDPEQRKYLDILFDFHYLRDPEAFEKNINSNPDLIDIDQEFQENHTEILDRFYKLFESIWRYQADFAKFIDDVQCGFYIQHSLDNILQDAAGKQLLSEALYLYGVMLLLLEEKIPGAIREKIMIAVYRYNGDGSLVNIEEVCKLCRSTGYIPGPEGRKPKNHPASFFGRFAPDPEFIRLVIGRLQTDDIYLMSSSYPNPDHRSTRLAQQASMLYVVLYFAPNLLHNQLASMREIVDKYFNNNWVIATYMGHVVDITKEWAAFAAARSALENVVNKNFVRDLSDRNASMIQKCLSDLKHYLKEGVLQQDFVLDNITDLMNCVRSCNVALRWRLLHRRCFIDMFRHIIQESVSPQMLVTLLLNTSQLEYTLKDILQQLLADKDAAWTDGKAAAADRMTELSEYFTGEKALSRVKRDVNMMNWFAGLAEQVRSLDLDEDHATSTGRKIQGLIAALEDVEQFESVDTNVQIKSFLNEAREIFRQMIRTVNIKQEFVSVVENVSDLSYAWETLGDYLQVFHERIRQDPSSVVLLRATFLKTASILDVPMIRITEIDSPDAASVAEYYSSELVEFVRLVLEVIPVSVFKMLSEIEQIQTHKMQPLPIRLEAKDLRDFAQLDLRFELAKLTHQVSIFTEGVLLMQKTLLGIIQVEPRQILQEGLRRELVKQIAAALHENLIFREMNRYEITTRMSQLAATLDGLRRSIEYLQDYIDIAGLKMYLEEMSRVISYNTEQEANRYLKKKTFDASSRFQSKAIPIPRYPSLPAIVPKLPSLNDDYSAVNFMGRVMNSLVFLTDFSNTVYAPGSCAWFGPQGNEKSRSSSSSSAITSAISSDSTERCGIRTFSLLERSLGTIGLRGLDRLFAFRTVFEFNALLKYYEVAVAPHSTFLDQMRETLFPEHRTVSGPSKVYTSAVKHMEGVMPALLKFISRIGQGQLIRRQIAFSLRFGCQLDAHILYQALDTFNESLVNEIAKHYRQPEKYPYPSDNNPLLFETTALLEACGLDDPMHKVYVTSQPLEGLPVVLLLFLLTYLPKLEYDVNFGALVRRQSNYLIDGVPLVVGTACLLRQVHPVATRKLLSYLGQYVRSRVQQEFGGSDLEVSRHKSSELPREVLNVLIFLDHLCKYSSIPRSVVHAYVPPYIFDAIRFPEALV